MCLADRGLDLTVQLYPDVLKIQLCTHHLFYMVGHSAIAHSACVPPGHVQLRSGDRESPLGILCVCGSHSQNSLSSKLPIVAAQRPRQLRLNRSQLVALDWSFCEV